MNIELKEGVDFELIPDDVEHDPYQVYSVVRILREPFKGIVVRVGTLKFGGATEDGEYLKIRFDFDYVSGPLGTSEYHLRNDFEFNQLLGSILLNILDDQLKQQEENPGAFTIRDSDIEVVEVDRGLLA